MDHYIDIKLLPDPEFPPTMLMNALFAKFHKGLIDHGGGDIGISFPEISQGTRTLGQRLRIHGNKDSLDRLMSLSWMQGIRDLVTTMPIQPVPDGAGYRVVRRVQAKSSPERLRRRLMARKGIGMEAARVAIPDCAAEILDLPFVEVTSRSTGHRFRVFIEHGKLKPTATSGAFSSYGLSATATVPWFQSLS